MLVVNHRGQLVHTDGVREWPATKEEDAAWHDGVKAEAAATREGLTRDDLEVRATLEAFARLRSGSSQEMLTRTLYGIFGGRSMWLKLYRLALWELEVKRSTRAAKRRGVVRVQP